MADIAVSDLAELPVSDLAELLRPADSLMVVRLALFGAFCAGMVAAATLMAWAAERRERAMDPARPTMEGYPYADDQRDTHIERDDVA